MIFWSRRRSDEISGCASLSKALRIAGRPARLLLFIGGQLRRDLAGGLHLGQELRAPTGQLRAVAEVEVFGQSLG